MDGINSEQIEAVLLQELDNIAPGCVPAEVDQTADIREALDLDSMDMLNLLTALHTRLGVDIPDADLGKFSTLESAVEYLADKTRSL